MLKLGDVQETALIPLAVRAEETKRKNARIHDLKAVKIIDDLYVDTKKYNKFFTRGCCCKNCHDRQRGKKFAEKIS